MKYSLSEIARIMGGVLLGPDRTVNRVVTDSRNVIDTAEPLFVAITGANRDGHAYIADLYDRGVRSFLVSRDVSADYPEAGFVLVDDTLAALQVWATYHRSQFKGTVIGITGSNGKTIVKEWIAQLAPADKKVFRSPRSYNSQLGVPLSILMLDGDEDVAVIEAGISQPGEMERLEKMIRPDVGILTHLGPAHEENFFTPRQKLEEKLLLFRAAETLIYDTENDGADVGIRTLYSDKKLFSIGRQGTGIPVLPADGRYTRVRVESGTRSFRFELPFTDRPSVENSLLALAAWLVLGADPAELIPRLNTLHPVAMRMEFREGIGGSVLVNDSYNADINSLSASLDYLQSVSGAQSKMLILSDIYQSGRDPRELYAEAARLAVQAGIETVIGIGPEISACSDLFPAPKAFYDSTRQFLAEMKREDFTGKAILIKGSRPFRFEQISRRLEKQVHTTVLEIDLDAMIHNLNAYRAKLAPETGIMAMVKALSYGAGSFEVAATLQHQRVDNLAVAFADEGVTLREAGITLPIVVLNADADSFGTMIDYALEPEIYSFESLAMFTSELNHRSEQQYPIHISFDTGMHRLGFVEPEMDRLIYLLKHTPAVSVRSAFTHFAVSDEPSQDDYTRHQIELFRSMADRLQAAFPGQKIRLHASNTAGIDRFPEARFDLVRLGLGLYGVSSFEKNLRPVGVLKSRIVQVKKLKAGDTVGYGRRGVCTDDTTIATVPIGYADGLDRRLSRGAWSFEVNGKLAPIIGNICMDTCMIDITGIEAREGDEAIVFGGQKSVSDMAVQLDTIPYEILTSVSARVKRVYIKE